MAWLLLQQYPVTYAAFGEDIFGVTLLTTAFCCKDHQSFPSKAIESGNLSLLALFTAASRSWKPLIKNYTCAGCLRSTFAADPLSSGAYSLACDHGPDRLDYLVSTITTRRFSSKNLLVRARAGNALPPKLIRL